MGAETDTFSWPGDIPVSVVSFVWFVQIYYGKTALMVKGRALVPYPFNLVFSNFCCPGRKSLVNEGLIVFAFLQVGKKESREHVSGDGVTLTQGCSSGFSFEVQSFGLVTSDASRRVQKMWMFYKALKMLLVLLNSYTVSRFHFTWNNCTMRNGFSLLYRNGLTFWGPRDKSCICHKTSMQRPCVKCLVCLIDVQDSRTGQMWMVTERNEERYRVKAILDSILSLKHLLISSGGGCSQRPGWSCIDAIVSCSMKIISERGKISWRSKARLLSHFYLHLLHKVYLGILDMLKECTMIFLCFSMEVT